MKIGLVGDGIVGGAFRRWQLENTKNKVLVYDEPKNIKDDFTGVECIFICLPAPTLPSRDQDISLIKQTLLRYQELGVPFFIRSTVTPGTTDRLSKALGVDCYFCPEFLTERIADQDFAKHDIICGTNGNPVASYLLSKVFPGKSIMCTTNLEAEISKYAHNCFGAVKVHYFNIINMLCIESGADYNKVLEAASVTGFIEPTHTQVPGPDGKYGYGGKCFPKDLSAFIGTLFQKNIPNAFLRRVEIENDILRTYGPNGFCVKPSLPDTKEV